MSGATMATTATSLRIHLPGTWRMIDATVSDARIAEALSTTPEGRAAIPLAEGLVRGLRNGDYQFCAFGEAFPPSGATISAAVTIRIDHEPRTAVADRAFDHAKEVGVPQSASITAFVADAGDGVRVAWRAIRGSTHAWCAEYFFYFPEGDRLAVVGTSLVTQEVDPELLEISDLIAGSIEFAS